MEIMKRLKGMVSFVANTLPTRAVEKLGHDKLAHGFATAYVVSVFECYGLLGGFIGYALMLALGYVREKNDDRKDVLWMAVFGAAEILRYIFFE